MSRADSAERLHFSGGGLAPSMYPGRSIKDGETSTQLELYLRNESQGGGPLVHRQTAKGSTGNEGRCSWPPSSTG